MKSEILVDQAVPVRGRHVSARTRNTVTTRHLSPLAVAVALP